MSRRLNFLHLTTFYPPYSFGGDAMYVYRLCHALADAGHHVDVIHCVDSYHLLHPEEPEIRTPEHPNVKRHELRSPLGSLSPLLTQQTGRPWLKSKQIASVLNSRSYDVLHFHNTSLLGLKALEMAPSQGEYIRLYTTHEHWLICPMHVLWKYTQLPCDEPDCLRCTLHGKRPPQLWRYTGMIERTTGFVDQFLSPSRFTAEMHAARGFPQRVDHLPYFLEPVDKDWMNPGPRPQERPYFLFVGRLEFIKGLQTLIHVWNRVRGYDLLIAGGGTYAEHLKRQARGNDRIRFLGPLSQAELGAVYYHALAVLVPSITYETFGVIIIEAFARKTPVIVRDLGALPEVVRDSGGGFIYQTDEELLQFIKNIGASQAYRNELGEKGYVAFRRHWTRQAHLKMYDHFLRRAALNKYGHVPWDDAGETPVVPGKSAKAIT